MTTNKERAEKAIQELTGTGELGKNAAQAIAQSLADAGLLMPDLPAPRMVDRYPGSVCWKVCTDPTAAARRHIGVRVDHAHRIKLNVVGESLPTEAREAAYALLAAADYAEQEQGNDEF